MKKYLFTLLFLSLLISLSAHKQVTIERTDGAKFQAQLLFSTDSILYVWVGLDDFDKTTLNRVSAIPHNHIKRIKLNNPVSWKQGMKKVLPYTFIMGILDTSVMLSRDEPVIGQILFGGIMTTIFTVPLGGAISLFSHVNQYAVMPYEKNELYIQEKIKKKFLLSPLDNDIILKIISEVKP